jgi:homocysteine S-methyltransferase
VNGSSLVKQRLIGIQANTSSISPEELDDSSEIIIEDAETLIVDMLKLRHYHHLKIFGGCCGTDQRHIQQLTERLF